MCCFLIYGGLLVWLYSLPVLASDEIAFYMWSDIPLNNTKSSGVWAYLNRPNCAGYGVIYWNMYIFCKNIFGAKAVWAMRALALIAWLSVSLGTILAGNATKKNLGWLLGMLWISMPIAWWTGKVSGPESFSVALSFFGIMLLHMSNLRTQESITTRSRGLVAVAWFLIGIGFGFKLTVLPMVVFALVIAYQPRSKEAFCHPKSIAQFLLVSCVPMMLGFVLANPVLVMDRAAYFKELSNLPKGETWSWSIAKLTLSNDVWTWDGVFSGGLTQWSLTPVVLLAFCVLTFWVRLQNGVALVAAFLSCWLLIISTGSTLGWYWFGLIPLVIPGILWSAQSNSHFRWIEWTIWAALVVNVCMQGTYIADQVEMKFWHERSQRQLPWLQRQISELTAGRNYDLVLDYSEVTYEVGLEIDVAMANEIIQTSPAVIPGLSHRWQEKVERLGDSARVRGTFSILSEAFVRIGQLGEIGTEGKSILLIISKRLACKQTFSNVDHFLRERVLAKSPPGTDAICLLDSPDFFLYVLRTAEAR